MTEQKDFGKKVLADLMWMVTPITVPLGLLNLVKDYGEYTYVSDKEDIERYYKDKTSKDVVKTITEKQKKNNKENKQKDGGFVEFLVILVIGVIVFYIIYRRLRK